MLEAFECIRNKQRQIEKPYTTKDVLEVVNDKIKPQKNEKRSNQTETGA